MLARSASTLSAGSASACLATAVDSPVSEASVTCSARTSNSRRSEGTLSPAASHTTSPGTSSAASTRRRRDSRSTVTSLATLRARAASASSARPSWMKPISALISTTPRITPASAHSPRKAATAPLAIRM